MFTLLVVVDVFLGCYVLFALAIAPDTRIDYHFSSESGIITILSSVMLSMASGFAGLAFYLSDSARRYGRLFWLLSCFGFLFFAFDELYQLHEVIGVILETELGLSDNFRNWNDAVVIVYGVIALFVIVGFVPEIIRYRGVAETMVIAFVFYLLHTLIDALADPETPLSMIVEDATKLFASSYLALCMLVAVLGMISAANSRSD
jgi:hypothetical protein